MSAPEELLPVLEAGGPDERLFIACACQHRAAYHDDDGCRWITPAKSTGGGGYSTATPETACTCPTPREVVYIGGRLPAPVAAS